MLEDERVFCKFIIETRYRGEPVDLTWELQQQIPKPCRNREWGAVYNRVQGYLHDLSARTGFDYLILYWGLPEDADHYSRCKQLTLF